MDVLPERAFLALVRVESARQDLCSTKVQPSGMWARTLAYSTFVSMEREGFSRAIAGARSPEDFALHRIGNGLAARGPEGGVAGTTARRRMSNEDTNPTQNEQTDPGFHGTVRGDRLWPDHRRAVRLKADPAYRSDPSYLSGLTCRRPAGAATDRRQSRPAGGEESGGRDGAATSASGP